MAGIREVTRLFIDQELSPAANAKRLVTVAKQGLADAIASGHATTNYTTTVDGQPNGSVDSAKQSIVYKFGYAAEAASYALSFLKIRAGGSGKFANSFWLSIDGKYFPPGNFDLSQIKPTSEIIIGNTMPYNRKIDVQLSGNRKLNYSLPAGIYDDCARALRRRFSSGILQAKRLSDYNFPSRYRQKNAGYRYQTPVLLISAR